MLPMTDDVLIWEVFALEHEGELEIFAGAELLLTWLQSFYFLIVF